MVVAATDDLHPYKYFEYWIWNFEEEAWWQSVSRVIQIPEARMRSKACQFSSVETQSCSFCLVLYLHGMRYGYLFKMTTTRYI